VATEAAWLNGNNLEKKKQRRGRGRRRRRKKKETNERKDLTLTGLLMEGPWRARFVLLPILTFKSRLSKLLFLLLPLGGPL
jgi:hypothetical protein